MTPVALWTGQLPGLRRLPRRRSLFIAGVVASIGAYGWFGGPFYLQWLTIAAVAWTIWRHRWPTELPIRLRSLEPPQGPDERAVMVEIRQDSVLLGWDVGILWFEKGGVGFVGRTVSFVIPRAIMQTSAAPALLQSTFRAPQLSAKVFETDVGIVPLAPEMRAEMTLARIDALPNSVTSETILPPTEIHPDLLQRGMEVRRRLPFLLLISLPSLVLCFTPVHHTPYLFRVATILGGVMVVLYAMLFGTSLPSEIRHRLPKEVQKRFR